MASFIPLWGSESRNRSAPRTVVAHARVDDDDLAELAQYRWHLSDTGYAARWAGGRKDKHRVRMHRQILGLERSDKRQTDHINRDKLDNRRQNLRVVAGDAENRQNVPARGGYSEHRGVTYDKTRGKWMAQAKCGALRWVKRFDTEEEAAAAARAWREQHMPFALD